ncbi:MAG TPA: twin-arginine translocase TatA/TatE family subunit [bacterium]|nr:twin-arginine translocase TatA/TatE family subunit [bacterium]
MFIGGVGPTELIIILVIILIVFGVGKLPEVGRGLGKGIREFKNASKDGELEASKEDKQLEDKPAEAKEKNDQA